MQRELDDVIRLHVEAPDGRALDLVMKDSMLVLRGNLATDDAVRLVVDAVDWPIKTEPGASLFSVTVDDRTAAVRRVDGELVLSGDLPVSLPARVFMAAIAAALEEKFDTLIAA
jgi:hypothetical protein